MRNLYGLYRALQAMDDATFKQFVNEGKNDFQVWIADALNLHRVAANVGLAKTKDEVLHALEGQ